MEKFKVKRNKYYLDGLEEKDRADEKNKIYTVINIRKLDDTADSYDMIDDETGEEVSTSSSCVEFKVKMNKKYLDSLDEEDRADENNKIYTVFNIRKWRDNTPDSYDMIDDENGEEVSTSSSWVEIIRD